MAESECHRRLTQALVRWVADDQLGGDPSLILVDDAFAGKRGFPPVIGGFRPDVYLAPGKSNVLVIGEAETAKDLERNHTVAQLSAFLGYCVSYPGALVVVAVPWYVVRCARSLLRHLQQRCCAETVRTVAIERLDG